MVIALSLMSDRFLTLETGRNILLQIAVNLCLSVGMTLIILTGGIDLSVGSLLGLCAILFGKMWRDAHLPVWLAAVGAILAGSAGGWLNALFITRLRLPPLIVTLGSFSLFRGLAEAITRGVDNFTNFPKSFLFLGQGYLFGKPRSARESEELLRVLPVAWTEQRAA